MIHSDIIESIESIKIEDGQSLEEDSNQAQLMIHNDIINTPVTISNVEVILVMDKINPTTVEGNSIVISKEGVVATVDTNEIDSLKKQYPNNDFYGFWSSLLMSGVIEPNGLQVYYTSEMDGYYIYTKDATVLETGILTTNHTPSNYKLDISTAKPIDFDLKEVTLPPEKIKSAADIYRRLEQKKDDIKKGIIRGSFLATLIITGSAYFLEQMKSIALQSQTEESLLGESLDKMFANISGTKLLVATDQSTELKKILNIHNVSAGLFKIHKQKFNAKSKQAFINPSVPNPKSELQDPIEVESFNNRTGWMIKW
jgi:hypothetical protein